MPLPRRALMLQVLVEFEATGQVEPHPFNQFEKWYHSIIGMHDRRKSGDFGQAIRTMKAWYYFWVLNFVVAGSAFCVIAVIVTVRGVGDLREMFKRLRIAGQKQNSTPDVPPPTT
jgi:hypothetical protein